MMSLAVCVLAGAVIGALLSRFGYFRSGSRPSAVNGKRGAFYGAVAGLVIYFAFGNTWRAYEPPKNVKAITEAEFEAEVLRADQPVVVDFYAPWCGPCKVLAPRLDALAGEFGGRVKFVSVNVDHAPELAARFNVQGIPTLLFFDGDGKAADSVVGLASEESMRAKLESLAAN